MGQEGLGCVEDTMILVSLEQKVQVQMRQGWAAQGMWGLNTPLGGLPFVGGGCSLRWLLKM